MAIRNLLFDAGGTIVFPNWTAIGEVLGLDGVALSAAEPEGRRLLDEAPSAGDASRWRLYMCAVARAAGAAEPTDEALLRLRALHDRENLWDQVPDDVVPALEALACRYRLALVSNSNGTVRRKLERVGLARFFETIVDSHEEGIEKPDPRLFALALERMGRGARAAESAYVGDLYHVDVVGARAAGMAAVLLDPHDRQGHLDCARIARLDQLGALLERLGARG